VSDTRADIKITALHLFNERGVDAVSTRDIAARVGISPGNLTYHFPAKNDIIAALCHDLIHHVDEALRLAQDDHHSDNALAFFYKQCRTIGRIQQEYRFIFEKRYAEIITSIPELQQYYRDVLKGRFVFYLQLHRRLVHEDLAVPALVKETNAFGYLINILGLFWHQETAIYFPEYSDEQRLDHSLSLLFQVYKPYLTRKGSRVLKTYLGDLAAY
jgi:AcrR family transcriptional regulator